MSIEGYVYEHKGTPARYRGEGFLYVVGFTETRIKVGRTNQPNSRLSSHIRAGRGILGIDPFVWVSEPHENYKASERALLSWCRERVGTKDRIEYFDIPFREVVQRAESIAA